MIAKRQFRGGKGILERFKDSLFQLLKYKIPQALCQGTPPFLRIISTLTLLMNL